MKFSTKTTYGLRALSNISHNYQGESISLAKIAQEENISLKYLERIFSLLKKADIVKSAKGVSGGYELAKKPNEINLFDVVNALEKGFNLFHCLGKNGKNYCSHKCNCQVVGALDKIQRSIILNLKNIHLSDL